MIGGLALLTLVTVPGPVEAAQLIVDPVFADHMVLQQGKTIPVRGSAPPGTTVSVAFAEATVITKADERGRWAARLAAQRGGTIASLSVRTSAGERVQFNDVAVGEVWLCSGQSNMDLAVRHASNPERTANEADGQPIRLLKVARAASASPAVTFKAEVPWSRASPSTVSGFSAACWHMGLSLRSQGIEVPIGLIHAAWGGSTIEDWMSAEALQASGIPAQSIEALREYASDPTQAVARVVEQTDQWAVANDPGSTDMNGWFEEQLRDADWASMQAPGHWERSGIKALSSYDGVVWFRRNFALTAAQAAESATLSLGRIDERDRVWINGRTVGATLSSTAERRYVVPAGLLRAGTNSIAVRVVDEMGGGGFSGPARAMNIDTGSSGAVSLAGSWRYRPSLSDEKWAQPPPSVPWAAPRGLTMAYNGMIAPLHDFPLAGVVWYQGESNASRAAGYRSLLENWRTDWRRQFNDLSLPIILAQLPGYGPRATRPTDAQWAQLREIQRQVAKDDPRTGLAVTIDLGVSNDIHPAHKDVVGQRLGSEAMRVAYDARVPVAPSPISARKVVGGVRIDFAGATDSLVTHGAAAPIGFEWCTAEKVCHFANATVQGSTVIVEASSRAAFVRYAWQSFPIVNLYASTGLPVVPFEIAVR